MTRGKFIALEGGEGVGKTTQARLLGAWLAEQGIRSVITREPGGSPGAEVIRQLFLGTRNWDTLTEVHLLMAARRDHLRTHIIPNLEAGIWVICDRFELSTLVYQGYMRGGDYWPIHQMNHVVCGGIIPNLYVVLDAPVRLAMERIRLRQTHHNRFDAVDEVEHTSARRGFAELAGVMYPGASVVIDASADKLTVHRTIKNIVQQRLIPSATDDTITAT